MAAYFSYYPTFAAVFVGLALVMILSSLIRRDWKGLPYVVVFTGPAAVAWVIYALYESNLDLGVAPIRIDLPFLWGGLLTLSAPAILYALVRIIELVFGIGFYAFRLANRRETPDEPLRSWQDPSQPHK